MNLNFNKSDDGLIPAVIQDKKTSKVLMLGYMNTEAFEKTKNERLVTFYSRTRKCLWTKGESSGNFLKVENILMDCDCDTLLIKALPVGPVCHSGADTCFNEKNTIDFGFLSELEQIIENRKKNPDEKSYTSQLFAKGINRIAKKLGEEAVELVIEAKDNNKDLFLNEAADLLYHLLVLLAAKDFKFSEIIDVLEKRNQK